MSGNKIDQESNKIDTLVFSARQGQWEKVWDILGGPYNPKHDYLFNVVPQGRRWGILHQAIYWNNREILQKILAYEACDTQTRTKQSKAECGDTSGFDATKLAESYGYKDMLKLLNTHEDKVHNQSIPTFLPHGNFYESSSLRLISTTIAAYKKAFHPNPIDQSKSVVTILGDIFNDISTSEHRWKEVMHVVCDSVYVVCKENYDKIIKSENRYQFFHSIIDTYTVEENCMYTYLNLAFRRQKEKGYKPSGYDLAIGPYAVMYQMLLLFWPELPRESGTTYRKMLLLQQDASKYKIGTRFVWQAIASSSVVHEKAVNFPTCGPTGEIDVMFTIDNKTSSRWQPRDIEKHARFKENERTYPAGAKFIVTGRKNEDAYLAISLKLLAD